MYNKAKRYSIPAYKEAKGMRGELIRKVVNYLHRLNDDTAIPTFRHNAHFAILTAHTIESRERCDDGAMIALQFYSPEADRMQQVCAEELYRKVEAWMPRRIEDKFIRVRLDGTGGITRYFKA